MDSIRTSSESRSSDQAERTTSRAISTEASGSAHCQPNAQMRAPAAIACTLPSASVATCSQAPRTLSEPCRPPRRSASPTRLTASPPTAIAGHRRRVDRTRRREASHRFADDHQSDRRQRRPVGERGEDLGAVVAEGALVGRRPPRDPEREQRQPQRGGVGEHVPGVGKQRQRVGEPTPGRLGDHVDRHQRQRPGQAAEAVGPVVNRVWGCVTMHRGRAHPTKARRPTIVSDACRPSRRSARR